MNRLQGSHSCRICRHWLEGDWSRAKTDSARRSVQRQMNNGMCDPCQRARQLAALQYIWTGEALRMLPWMLTASARPSRYVKTDAVREQYVRAEAQCRALGMW